LDILDGFRENDWEDYPCNVDAFAKYIWKRYLIEEDDAKGKSKKTAGKPKEDHTKPDKATVENV
jgi:hypothetical protein